MALRRRSTRRPLRKRRGLKRRFNRGKRSLNAMKQDRATVIETQELTATPEGGNMIGHQLSQYARATAVSQNYRFFRCKKVELEFIPYANMFPGGTAFPELYYQVDRTQGLTAPGVPLPLPTKNMMLARGVLPIKWTSVVKRSYVPSVLRNENFYQNVSAGNVLSIAATTSTPVKNKWYATQQYFANPTPEAASPVWGTYAPTALRYFGAAYFIDQPLAPVGAVLGTIKMRVHWEFKEPLWTRDVEAPQEVAH